MIQKLIYLFNTLGVLNDDNKVSLTNITVYVFLVITAVRGLFAGAIFDLSFFTWKVEGLDFANTLPLLFALLNYHGKRTVNQIETIAEKVTTEKGNT